MDKGFGKYDVYAVAGSIYCYRDRNVLKNRFGLRDGAKLRAVEADVSLLRQRELWKARSMVGLRFLTCAGSTAICWETSTPLRDTSGGKTL